MGGFGSGDWMDVAKRKMTVELCRTISAKSLKDNGFFAENKSGVITWTNNFGENIGMLKIQSYVSGNGNKTYLELTTEGFVTSRQEIGLTTTPCYYGRWRWWFVCPLYTYIIAVSPHKARVNTPYRFQSYAAWHTTVLGLNSGINSSICSSVAWRTTAGTSVKLANWAARNRLSPVMSSKRVPDALTMIG